MNVISENNTVLDSSVSVGSIDGCFGLIMKARGGVIGKPDARNTDYALALDTILTRLKNSGVKIIRVYVVSSKALKIWSTMEDRALAIDGTRDIDLSVYDVKTLRGKLGKAQQEKKENPKSKGGNPTKRILIDAGITDTKWFDIVQGKAEFIAIFEEDIVSSGYAFDPNDAESAKERISSSISVRRGQTKFRNALLRAYEGECAITGTNTPSVLEAAHIVPYQGNNTNHITNGILLRSDIHTLFDLGLIEIDKHYEVVVASSLNGSEYEKYHGKRIFVPNEKYDRPSLLAIQSRTS